MLKNSLIDILKVLKKKEIKDLNDFVISPFHNKNKNVVRLFNILKKYYPEFDSVKLNKETIYAKIFPGIKYNDNTMRSLIFGLSNIVMEYLAVNSLRKNEFDAKRYAALEFLERGADSLFLKSIEKAKDLLKVTPVNKHLTYLDDFLLLNLMYAYSGERHILQGIEEITGYSNILINFFLYHLLDINSFIINKKNIVSFNYNARLLDEILNYIETNDFEGEPLILLKYYILKLSIDNSDTGCYYKIKNILKTDFASINHNDKYNAYILLQNVSVNNWQEGKEEFKNELAEIYDMMLSKGIYAGGSDEFMSHLLYKNIAAFMLNLNKLKWVENFINEYKDRLEPKNKESAYRFSRARLAFAGKRYSDCLELLSKVTYEDISYKMEVKVLAIKTHYELGNYETILSSLDSFRHFLGNKLMTGHFAEMCNNFIKSVNHLIRLKESKPDLNSFNEYLFQLNSRKAIVSRDWLLSKANEIMGNDGGKNI